MPDETIPHRGGATDRRQLLKALAAFAAGPLVSPQLLSLPLSQPLSAAVPEVPTRAPDFSLPAVDGGTRVRLSAYRGKVVLLNFWATWCGPCLSEIPRLVDWQSRLQSRGLQVIGASMDDSPEPVAAWIQRLRINYPVVMSDRRLSLSYGGVLGLPMSFLIDRSGLLRRRVEGVLNPAADLSEIERLLAQGSGAGLHAGEKTVRS